MRRLQGSSPYGSSQFDYRGRVSDKASVVSWKPQFVGELLDDHARDLFGEHQVPLASNRPQDAKQAPRQSIVRVERSEDGWRLKDVLAERGSALEKMYRIAAKHQLDPVFGPQVEREVQGLLDNPGIDDPALRDLTDLPFVTIDGPGTRDLDQAVHICRDHGGWRVCYALADPSWCVRPGTALFDEALRRGATYYLPGVAIPMLPRALSEGIVSLNANQNRRAVVFVMRVNASGHCHSTQIVRARVRSRAQLTFGQVQRFLDHGTPLTAREGS